METDEQLYSRQLYVIGKDAQLRLQRANVLLSGQLNGLASEIAKNVVLTGVHSLTLHDDSPCRVADLSCHLFARTEDVEQATSRAQVTCERVKGLNSNVRVDVANGELSDADYEQFSVVVLVNETRAVVERVNAICRAKGIPFCATGMYGLYGFAFSDFGESWTVKDVDGENPNSGLVLSIDDVDGSLLVRTPANKHHGLVDGDVVKFTGVQGLEMLNQRLYEVATVDVAQVGADGNEKKVGGCAFKLTRALKDDDSGFESIQLSATEYQGGGYYEQVKQPQTFSYQSFAESFLAPSVTPNYWDDVNKPLKLHGFLQALFDFQANNVDGRFPADSQFAMVKPWNLVQASAVAESAMVAYSSLANESTEPPSESDKNRFLALALTMAGQLNPIASYFGGIVGQEVLKACSQKFTPLNQWLHFEAANCLPLDKLSALAEREYATLDQLFGTPMGSVAPLRYTGQSVVFGREFQETLANLRYFLVGAGALGCELLKNLALTGCCTGKNGQLRVTDMDGIEVSNLNRQFLFRPKHVGKMKSTVAAESVKQINPEFNVTPMQDKVAPETEHIFDDVFWDGVDGVINALDNVAARLYVDSKCLAYGKPLLESGTLGSKSNSLPIVPQLTESYGSDPVQDDNSESIPACTLHAYPNLIEHTLAWARDSLFEKYFRLDSTEARGFLEALQAEDTAAGLRAYRQNLERQANTKLARLRTVKQFLVSMDVTDQSDGLFPYELQVGGEMTFGKCVYLARCRFEEHFVNRIAQLLATHPLDKVGNDDTPFWSGARRPPCPLPFDASDELHVRFVVACAKLYARTYGLELPGDGSPDALRAVVLEKLGGLQPLNPFVPKSDVKIAENDEEVKKMQEEEAKAAEKNAQSIDQQCNELFSEVCSALNHDNGSAASVVLHPQEFEKDDDENGHMEFIFAAANLRARCYKIPEVDFLKAKQIVGRIVPAIATTTAMTTGLVMLELFKLCSPHCDSVEYFCSTNSNLAVNSYAIFEPTPCQDKFFGKKNWQAQQLNRGLRFNLWTNITLRGNQSIQGVIDYFLETYNFEVMSIGTSGDVVLFSDFLSYDDEYTEKPVSEVYEEVVGNKPPSRYIPLIIDGDFELDDSDEDESDDEEEVEIPGFRVAWACEEG